MAAATSRTVKAGQSAKTTKTGPAAKSAATPAPAGKSAKAASKTAAKAAPSAPPAKTASKAAAKTAPKTAAAKSLAPAPASPSAAKSPARPSSAPAAAPSAARTNPPAGMPAGVPAGPARPATGVRPPVTPRPAGTTGLGSGDASQVARPGLTPARPAVAPARPGVAPGRPAVGQPRPVAPSAVPSVRLGIRVGTGKWSYEPVPDWGRGPGGVPEFGTVSGIACDSKDNVYVFQRTIEPCVLVFNPDGSLLRKFGADTFRNPHGIWIGPDATRRGEEVALLTDRDLHQVVKYTLEGRKLATWGAAYREPGDAGQPFNQPARATLGPRGEMYVADGYGQYRVHQFSPEGELAHSWGKRGKGPGEFGWPVHHALLDPRGRLIVSDRGNNRLQLFSPRGKYQGEWTDLDMPQDYVITRENEIMLCEGSAKRIAVLDLDGNVLARWGEGGSRPGQFAASPHSLWVDSRGDLYVGEVIDPNRLTKFVRR